MVGAPASDGFHFSQELAKFRIDKNTLQFYKPKMQNAAYELAKKIKKSLQEQNKKDQLSRNILYLISPQEEKFFSNDAWKIEDNSYPAIGKVLKDILAKVLESKLDFIDPQQLFNAVLDMKRIRNLELVSPPKRTKWNKSKIILKSKEKAKNQTRYRYFYYLPTINRDNARLEHKRWLSGFENSIQGVDGSSLVTFRNENGGSNGMISPVFELPNIMGDTLNQLFLDPRNDEYIGRAIIDKFRSGNEITLGKKWDDESRDLMLHQFRYVRNLFPRIQQYWEELTLEARYFCYQNFDNIARNGFKLLHDITDEDLSQIHGDEWGNNFHLVNGKDGKVLVSIDFDDTIQMDASDYQRSRELLSTKRNSHLYKRIWMRTTEQDYNQYVENEFNVPDEISLRAGFDLTRSYGRLVCSLIQYWLLKSPTGTEEMSEIEEQRIGDFFHSLKKGFEGKNRCYGWFCLSIIDWSIEWGLNERREQNDKNKFPQMRKFIEILSEVFREENVPLKFKSRLIEDFQQIFFDLDATDLSKYFGYVNDYENLDNEWRITRDEIYTFHPENLSKSEDTKDWLETIIGFENMINVKGQVTIGRKSSQNQGHQDFFSIISKANELYFQRFCINVNISKEEVKHLESTLENSDMKLFIGDRFSETIIQYLS
ncbi:MAG TPA: hypothetical protein D7I06_05320 [Candidatus Poseidoniales archaeon]|nr:MAG TPA: hypothetical protein D7I06_05320 [Candidatus Poseidoniales archaeon]HII63007.1 hypothetical protein [Candidatus Poseidoniaceae archaeon]|tara:strand:+ start:770 stop:2731 length:1962 start_codon:yes stop_codon:yes gene_type:complete